MDSLRVRLDHALKEKYPDYLTINEIDEICREFHKKISNAERRFRFDNKAPHLYIPNKRIWNEKGTSIIGYEWIGDHKINIQVVSLDDRLRELLKQIKPSWDNYEKINEIERAIKSPYENTKKRVLGNLREPAEI